MMGAAPSPEALARAAILWNYLRVRHDAEPADCILVFGGHDAEIGAHAASLFARQLSPRIIVSGGAANLPDVSDAEGTTEAEIIGNRIRRCGVGEESLLLETRAQNTAENFRFVEELLASHGHGFHSFLLVAKPYAERRVHATGLRLWPGKTLIVHGLDVSMNDYMSGTIDPARIISMMMGEIERIPLYAGQGWCVPQHIPDDVLEATAKLREIGHAGRAVRDYRAST